jgi:hypothetical protein
MGSNLFRFKPARDHLLVACFPKSGSTFLSRALSLATGFPMRPLSVMFQHNEQDICQHKLRRLRQRSVVHQHVKGTFNNVWLLNQYQVKPVILVRNIFDTVISLNDHLRLEDHRIPTGYVHREFWNLDFDAAIHFLIRNHLPWYFSFLISWREAASQITCFRLTYRRLFSDVPAILHEVLDFYKISTVRGHVERVASEMKSVDTRFNKGVRGRGEQLLTAEHKQAIWQLADSWQVGPDVLAEIGLERCPAPAGQAPLRSAGVSPVCALQI